MYHLCILLWDHRNCMTGGFHCLTLLRGSPALLFSQPQALTLKKTHRNTQILVCSTILFPKINTKTVFNVSRSWSASLPLNSSFLPFASLSWGCRGRFAGSRTTWLMCVQKWCPSFFTATFIRLEPGGKTEHNVWMHVERSLTARNSWVALWFSQVSLSPKECFHRDIYLIRAVLILSGSKHFCCALVALADLQHFPQLSLITFNVADILHTNVSSIWREKLLQTTWHMNPLSIHAVRF